ncbi:MAG: hypothetical protein AB8I08_33715 [Sandaracinaceae bacterium]
MTRITPWSLSLVLVLGLASACTAGSNLPDSGDSFENTDEECRNGEDDDDDGWVDCEDPGCAGLPLCLPDDAGPPRDGGFSGCVGTPYEAEEAFAPVDIVWVVDTSGSMSDEAERVQENMQRFADSIGAVGLDWHVVMISTQDFVNVPASLADDPRYLLVERDVFSDQPLHALVDEYSRYSDFLRRRAVTHFVAVTDDDSSLAWESFRTTMTMNLGRNFIFHAIASERVPGSGGFPPNDACVPPGGGFGDGAADVGEEYYELAAATGGRTFSICTPSAEWTGLFDTLTTAIAVPQTIPCEYDIPEPPSDTELDFNRVNIRYNSSSGGSNVFPYVGGDDGADCTSGGWYYDDAAAPTRIILCPNTCSVVNGDSGGTVNVELGCLTFII